MNNKDKVIGFYYPGSKTQTARIATIKNTIALLEANGYKSKIIDHYDPEIDMIINQVNDGQGLELLNQNNLHKYYDNNIPIINSIDWFCNSVDKFITYQKLKEAKLPTIDTVLLNDFKNNWPAPWYLKDRRGTTGKHVYFIANKQELDKILNNHKLSLPEMIIQPDFKDIECWRIIATKDKSIVSYVKEGEGIKSIHGGSKRNYKKATDKINNLAINTVKTMGVDIAGVDILVNKQGESSILELNPNFGYEIESHKVSKMVSEAFYNLIIQKL